MEVLVHRIGDKWLCSCQLWKLRCGYSTSKALRVLGKSGFQYSSRDLLLLRRPSYCTRSPLASFTPSIATPLLGSQVSLSASIRVDATSIWVVLKDGRLFCSGGGDWNTVFLISADREVSRLPNMQTARNAHGDGFLIEKCTDI